MTTTTPPRRAPVLARIGLWLRDHKSTVAKLQWAVVGIYAVLIIAPLCVPMPDHTRHIWNHITYFAQFAFWGIWWPGVLISMLLLGRMWCGVLCPEGTLTEYASRHGRARSVPRWIRWPAWPFVAFVMTTVYGQMISVYQYPWAVALILGGSTLGALAVGYLYGREKRVWCRYLCPVNGVFGLLSKVAPLHYGVDRAAWDGHSAKGQTPFNCAPLVAVRVMESSSACHMCGRCAGFREAVTLEARRPDEEITTVSARQATVWDSLLIITGMMGVATGAFQWSASPWFITAKQSLAAWLVRHDILWPLTQSAPWFILTNYPERNDVLTFLDGGVMLAYIGAIAALVTVWVAGALATAVRLAGPWQGGRFNHLAHTLIPLAAVGVILGLSAQTVTLLKSDGVHLIGVAEARAAVMALALAAVGWLAWRVSGQWCRGARRLGVVGLVLLASAMPLYLWCLMFFVW